MNQGKMKFAISRQLYIMALSQPTRENSAIDRELVTVRERAFTLGNRSRNRR
jgi:hypothetical protein